MPTKKEKPYGLTVRGIIRNSYGEILILKRHPKSNYGSDMWELPGGKVEKGEFFDEALIREIKEETNLDCRLGDLCTAIPEDYPHKRTVQIIMYLEDVSGDVAISDEHTDYKWAKISEIEKLETTPVLERVLSAKLTHDFM